MIRRERRDVLSPEARLAALVDQRVAAVRAEIEDLRGTVIKIAQTGLKHLDAAVDQKGRSADTITDQVERLFAKLESKIDQALPRRAERGGEIVDLPNPLVRHMR